MQPAVSPRAGQRRRRMVAAHLIVLIHRPRPFCRVSSLRSGTAPPHDRSYVDQVVTFSQSGSRGSVRAAPNFGYAYRRDRPEVHLHVQNKNRFNHLVDASSRFMRSDKLLCLSLLAFLLAGANTASSSALTAPADQPQTLPSQDSSTQRQTNPQGMAAPDYQQRESQPNLKVDRDPVLSPSPAANAPWVATPQTPGVVIQKSKSNVYTLRENVDEVVLSCTVLNQKNKLQLGLGPSNFRIWEDGVPQKIASFRYGDVPVSMGILIDNSASMMDKREAVAKAALTLIRDSNPRDRTFVVNFNDKA